MSILEETVSRSTSGKTRTRDRTAFARLARPPRPVPLSLRIRLLLGSPLAQFAWAFFGIALSFTLFFASKGDVTSWMRLRAPARAAGVIVGCADTGSRVGGTRRSRVTDPATRVYANHFRFEAVGAKHGGTSFATGTCLKPGTNVVVEYAPDDPRFARVEGMRRGEVSGAAILAVLLFMAVSSALLVAATALGLRMVRYLARGELVLGKLVGSESTRVSVNDRRLMKLRFAIEQRGVLREVVVKTLNPGALEDDPREPLLFDATRPATAVAWDVLPAVVGLDASGALRPVPVGRSLVVLLPAVAGIAASIFFALL